MCGCEVWKKRLIDFALRVRERVMLTSDAIGIGILLFILDPVATNV